MFAINTPMVRRNPSAGRISNSDGAHVSRPLYR